MTGSPPYAVPNLELVLTCSVTNASNLHDQIYFIKQSNDFWYIVQQGDYCTPQIQPDDHYELSCGAGTNSSLADVKMYSLTIKKVEYNSDSVRGDDVMDWWCYLKEDGVRSNVVSVTAESKLMDLDTFLILKST